MKNLQFPKIDELDLQDLKKMGKSKMKSVKGGYTGNTATVPQGTDDGDDGWHND
jgi:hypothetical protein